MGMLERDCEICGASINMVSDAHKKHMDWHLTINHWIKQNADDIKVLKTYHE